MARQFKAHRHLIRKSLSLARDLVRPFAPALAKSISRRINDINERYHWMDRIHDVLACSDNMRLPRVAGAGSIMNGFQVMHNGIEVLSDGYYGNGMTQLLKANRGCHEPQEEVVFDSIVRSLPPAAVMIEAGSYWAFYSMWFCKVVPHPRAYLIEPEEANLEIGRKNFAHNNCEGEFSRGYVGATPATAADGLEIIALDNFAAHRGLDHIHVLHADVQGFELNMLLGCQRLLADHSVDYFFISTHSMELHHQCRDMLVQHDYRILASIDLEETCCVDGILVASSPKVSAPAFAPPSKKVQV